LAKGTHILPCLVCSLGNTSLIIVVGGDGGGGGGGGSVVMVFWRSSASVSSMVGLLQSDPLLE